jgi:Tol biopolymer transport system component
VSPARIAAGAALAALLALATTAGATSLPDRTFRVSAASDLGDLDGASGDTSLSADGLIVGFTSTATSFTADDANGATRDIFTFNVATGERQLVSRALGGTGADGPSSTPALSADGQRVAFASTASNLVAGDGNGVGDIFFADHDGPVTRVSVAAGGGDPDGASSNPDISADGRYVVFESAADNLVPGDTNGLPDVFLRDLQTGTTKLVSAGRNGAPANGASGAPAISAAGGAVSFASKASNLVPGDSNGVGDVFVRSLAAGKTERVSVDSRGRQQRAAVAEPFSQISDISSDGRYVVFDSDATNLVTADANRHTDVFLRDRRRHTTVLVSASSLNVQGNNDSFSPLITADGRIVAFQSFATNMAPGDGPREDVFVRDLGQRTTSVVDVADDGGPRGPELVPQLLQRPALSSDGRVAAFSSTAENLVAGDGNRSEDVFLRLLDAPQADLVRRPAPARRPIVELTADDPAATRFICQVDRGPLFECARGRTRMPLLAGGRHTLKVRAGGPGMLYDSQPLEVGLDVDRKPPAVQIGGFGQGPLRTVRGTASDRAGVARVIVAVTYFAGKGCRTLVGARFKSAPCPARVFQPAKGTRHWSLRLPRSVRGPVVVYVRAVDNAGNASRVVLRKGIVP